MKVFLFNAAKISPECKICAAIFFKFSQDNMPQNILEIQAFGSPTVMPFAKILQLPQTSHPAL